MEPIESPVDIWPGTITLKENLYLPQTVAVIEAVEETGFLNKEEGEPFFVKLSDHLTMLPAILDCIDEWNIEGYPRPTSEKDFLGRPLAKATTLATWLFNEVFNYILDVDSVPNE